jgi:hypothetical protein
LLPHFAATSSASAAAVSVLMGTLSLATSF